MGVFGIATEDKLSNSLLQMVEALINEHGSSTILRERLALLADRIRALERENGNLRAQLAQAQASAQDYQSRLDRFCQASVGACM